MKKFLTHIRFWDIDTAHVLSVYETETGYIMELDNKATLKAFSTNREDLQDELNGIMKDIMNNSCCISSWIEGMKEARA